MRNESIVSQKENYIPLDRRLSLKFSSTANPKANPRMSIPMRRESLASNCTRNVSSFNMQPDIGREYRPSLVSNTSNVSKQSKKSAILSNLVRKLDHQQELKEIIQSKIQNFQNIAYPEASFSNNTEHLESKLRYYEQEVQCFKDIISELIEKINALEGNKATTNQPNFHKQLRKSCEVQTDESYENQYKNINAPRVEDSKDFMDNLDCTLKVLKRQSNK